jgi:O-antigen ligase
MTRPSLESAGSARSPLLYWVTLAYIVGLPNFVHFDPTGRTADPINLTSILNVIETFVTGYLLVVCLLLERTGVIRRRVKISLWLWVALCLQFTLASLLQPEFHVNASANKDLLLSLFSIGQWVVAFLLIVATYSRSFEGHATELIVSLIGRASWIWIAIVWIVLPIMPGQVYGESDENSQGLRQLGGELIHPGKLATLAGVAFFYALFFFPRGPRKWLACGLAFVTIALTGARTGELGFVVAFLLYTLLVSRHALFRWGAIFGLVLASVAGLAFTTTVMKYVTRGQSAKTLTSLNDRTRIWQASWEAIRLRPLLGYGYVVGAKRALKEHWRFAHWIPPHPHNEFIGSIVDGGFVALGILICIYALVFWQTCRNAFRGYYPFFLVVYLQLLVSSVSGPILSYRYGVVGAIFLLCCIGVLGERRGKRSAYPSSELRQFNGESRATLPVMQGSVL